MNQLEIDRLCMEGHALLDQIEATMRFIFESIQAKETV